MPVVDRREFGGRFTVRENSQRLANYRYLEVQLMEMVAGWCHTTPQLAFKAAFGSPEPRFSFMRGGDSQDEPTSAGPVVGE